MKREPLDLAPKTLHEVETLAAVKMAAKRSTAKVEVPVREFCADLIAGIKIAPFTNDEIKEIYYAICNRLTNKTCTVCGKLKVELEGRMTWPNGDMSRPKQFVCKDC